MNEPLLHPEAQGLAFFYLCSSCWGHLTMKFAPNRKYIVECAKCGKDTRGFVTKTYVEMRRNESRCEKIEAEQVLKEAGIIPKSAKSADEILDELGY